MTGASQASKLQSQQRGNPGPNPGGRTKPYVKVTLPLVSRKLDMILSEHLVLVMTSIRVQHINSRFTKFEP